MPRPAPAAAAARGSRPTGDPPPQSRPSRPGSDLIPTVSLPSSAITGTPCPAPAAASSTGPQPSAIAAACSLAAAARQARTEREARQALQALLARRLGSSPVVVLHSAFAGGQYDGDIARIVLPAGDALTLAQAWREVEPLCRPAGSDRDAERRIIEEWARTVAVAAGRPGQGIDE